MIELTPTDRSPPGSANVSDALVLRLTLRDWPVTQCAAVRAWVPPASNELLQRNRPLGWEMIRSPTASKALPRGTSCTSRIISDDVPLLRLHNKRQRVSHRGKIPDAG